MFVRFRFIYYIFEGNIYFSEKEAVFAGAKFIAFPENFSFFGTKDGESLTIAEPLDGPIMQGYRSLARSDYCKLKFEKA